MRQLKTNQHYCLILRDARATYKHLISVIEIKEINDWKEALGKILAYSAFSPEHGKRIHLFGKLDLTKLALAQATCSEFGITVTFEEVG